MRDDEEMATNNMDEARTTYERFMATLKWAVPLIAVITLFVITLIAD